MKIDLSLYYTASQAAEVLTKNSGKEIKPFYVRQLARYGKLTPIEIDDRRYLYPKAQVDAYVVEERGEKSGRASSLRKKLKGQ